MTHDANSGKSGPEVITTGQAVRYAAELFQQLIDVQVYIDERLAEDSPAIKSETHDALMHIRKMVTA